MRQDLGTSAGVAAAGFVAFSVAMAASRFAGTVVTFCYVGSVLGPLVSGGLSEITSVRFALVLRVLSALTICAGARILAPAPGG